jgi:catechol 2,3-dioxygenase-like lactoylglutathione lyase family enzyme
MIVGIEHVAIASADPQALAGWYADTLGFEIVYNSGRTVFVKAANGSMIEIITAEGPRAAQTLKDPGLRHLAIAVSDFEAAYGRLKEKVVSFVSEPADSQGTKTVFFADPEGNYLHLIQRPAPLG